MDRKLASAAVLAIVAMVPLHSVAAKPDTNVTDLGSLSRGPSYAFGINNDAATVDVVGYSRSVTGVVHGFFWTTPGPMVDLGGLEGCESFTRDINNHRQIAGVSADRTGRRWPVLWTNVGGMWSLEQLPTLNGGVFDDALGINNGIGGEPGTVALVGVSASRAVIWTRSPTGWTVQDLGTLPGDSFSQASDINDHGDIVGVSFNRATNVTTAVLWTSAGIVRLPPLFPDGATFANAIANSGDVTGTSTDAHGNSHAVRWRSATAWTIEDLGTLGGCCSDASGINSFGDVVGSSSTSQRPRGPWHPFIANSMGMTDLNSMPGGGSVRDVNDFGLAVGWRDVRDTSHAVVWRVQ